MIAERHFGSDRPVTWIGTYPIYVSTLLAALHGFTMILSALALGAGAEGLLQAFAFSSSSVLKEGAVWQPVTYAFVHRPPYLLFLLEIYLLAVFGREIERYLGRAAFIQLYAALLLLPPVLLTAAGLLGMPTTLAGSSALHFGVFVAFAVVYPRAEIFFSIQARWVVVALLVVNVVQCVALNDFVSLTVLLIDCAAAFVLVLQMRGTPLIRLPERAPQTPPPAARKRPPAAAVSLRVEESIDPILEKISRTGLASLSASERQVLEQARKELLAREKEQTKL